eukprot:4472714-Ditylum_brightwellii.AAC.1
MASNQGTGFAEILPVKQKLCDYMAKRFNMGWLCRYPMPQEVINSNSGKFVGKKFQELLHSYGIKDVPTTVKNLQAHTNVKRMHLMIGDMLNMAILNEKIAIPSSIPYSPGMLVFNYGMIMQTKVRVDWEVIKKKHLENMIKNNIKENKSQIKQEYKVGDKVLIAKLREQRNKTPKLSKHTEGPYNIKK